MIVLNGLVDAKVLCLKSDGAYARVSDGEGYRPRPARAAWESRNNPRRLRDVTTTGATTKTIRRRVAEATRGNGTPVARAAESSSGNAHAQARNASTERLMPRPPTPTVEGVGVSADVEVPLSPTALREGRDTQLEAAPATVTRPMTRADSRLALRLESATPIRRGYWRCSRC
jgi:hypothetical protein